MAQPSSYQPLHFFQSQYQPASQCSYQTAPQAGYLGERPADPSIYPPPGTYPRYPPAYDTASCSNAQPYPRATAVMLRGTDAPAAGVYHDQRQQSDILAHDLQRPSPTATTAVTGQYTAGDGAALNSACHPHTQFVSPSSQGVTAGTSHTAVLTYAPSSEGDAQQLEFEKARFSCRVDERVSAYAAARPPSWTSQSASPLSSRLSSMRSLSSSSFTSFNSFSSSLKSSMSRVSSSLNRSFSSSSHSWQNPTTVLPSYSQHSASPIQFVPQDFRGLPPSNTIRFARKKAPTDGLERQWFVDYCVDTHSVTFVKIKVSWYNLQKKYWRYPTGKSVDTVEYNCKDGVSINMKEFTPEDPNINAELEARGEQWRSVSAMYGEGRSDVMPGETVSLVGSVVHTLNSCAVKNNTYTEFLYELLRTKSDESRLSQLSVPMPFKLSSIPLVSVIIAMLAASNRVEDAFKLLLKAPREALAFAISLWANCAIQNLKEDLLMKICHYAARTTSPEVHRATGHMMKHYLRYQQLIGRSPPHDDELQKSASDFLGHMREVVETGSFSVDPVHAGNLLAIMLGGAVLIAIERDILADVKVQKKMLAMKSVVTIALGPLCHTADAVFLSMSSAFASAGTDMAQTFGGLGTFSNFSRTVSALDAAAELRALLRKSMIQQSLFESLQGNHMLDQAYETMERIISPK